MEQAQLQRLGDALYEAMVNNQVLAPISTQYPQLTEADAYAIQQRLLQRRLAAGERVVGKKIGVTSQAVMDLLGVFQPDFGWLTDGMRYRSGQAIPADRLIQPKAEGEIAFILARPLAGPGVTVDDVLQATETVAACFEIVDSRIENWRIGIQDTIADNASCGVFVLGDAPVPVQAADLVGCQMTMRCNGEVVATGMGAAAMGHPARAVAWLADKLGELGACLDAGDIVLSGSLGVMVPVAAGDVFELHISGIGSCLTRFS